MTESRPGHNIDKITIRMYNDFVRHLLIGGSMRVTQRSGGRSIRIEGGKVTVNGQELAPAEADKIREEGLAKLRQAMHAVRPSPQKSDSVVVVIATGVHVSGTGVTIRRK